MLGYRIVVNQVWNHAPVIILEVYIDLNLMSVSHNV
jgi:hypothetical protein